MDIEFYNSIKDERLKILYKEDKYTVYTKEQWDEEVENTFKCTSLVDSHLFKNQESDFNKIVTKDKIYLFWLGSYYNRYY